MNIDTKNPICVTGATGYVAGVLVKELLEAGCTVHAPVRDPSNKERLKYLTDIADKSAGGIEFFKADLLDEGSYLESMQGCSIVFHTASPFVMSVPKGREKEILLDPAVKGTQNVLKSAAETSSVKRVVLTSSVYAVAVDAQDSLDVEKCDESVWNNVSSIKYNPYAYSKVLAEKAAWEIAKAEDTKYELVVVNPSWVMGPGIKAHPSSESFGFVKKVGDGEMKSGCPKVGTWVVDVRDVAKGHLAAAFMETASGRNIISGHNTDMLAMASAIRAKYPDYPLPEKALPKFLLWLLGPFVGMPRRMVSRSCNIEPKLDASKSVEKLNMTYRPLEDTMQEMFCQMIEAGLIKDPSGK